MPRVEWSPTAVAAAFGEQALVRVPAAQWEALRSELAKYRSREPMVTALIVAALNDDNASRDVDDAVSCLRLCGYKISREGS
jgi:hypothetical protein